MKTPVRAAVAVVALGTILAPGTFAALGPQQPPASGTQPRSIVPAPARRTGEGRGPFKTLVIRNAIVIDGTGAPPVGPVDIVVSGNRIDAVRSAGTPGICAAAEPAAAERRSGDRRHRHVRDARLRRQPRPRGRTAQERGCGVRLQAVDGARRHFRHRRPAGRPRVHGQREGAERAQRDRRPAHRQLPASRRRLGARRGRDAGAGARVGALGQGQRHRRPQARRAASRHHGRAAQRGEAEPDGARPRTCSRPASRR